MTKDVLIAISGLHFSEGDTSPTPIEVISGGTFYKKNDSSYVLYDELSEPDGEITKNKIKIQDGLVELSKKGNNITHMKFEKGKLNHTYYETPFGSLLLGITAEKIEICEEDDQMDVDIRYSLEANGSPFADCKIKISVSSKNKGAELFNA